MTQSPKKTSTFITIGWIMKYSPTITICITVVIALEIIGGAVGVLAGRDIGQLITFFAIVNSAAVPGIAALVKIEQTDKKVVEVDHKVNGHLARLTNMAVDNGHTPDPLPPPVPHG